MNADRKTKILVVEDDHLFLWSLEQFLKREGYDVRPATTAELAFDMAQKESFDIVISDFHLPGLNGKELIKKVRLLNPLTKTIELRNLKRLLHDLTATTALAEAPRR
jgi:DNA-binding response OmpR family regulator